MKVLTAKQKLESMVQKGPLLQWLKQQDPSTRFAYNKGDDCVCARYLRGQGYEDVLVYPHSVVVDLSVSNHCWCKLPEDVAVALCSETYGEVIAKLEASA